MRRISLKSERAEETNLTFKSSPPKNLSPSNERRHEQRFWSRDHSILLQKLMAIMAPSLKVGAGAGTIGMFIGVAVGIARSTTPVLFGLMSSFQWFTLASSFWAARMAGINVFGGDEKPLSRGGMIIASGIAGGFAGTLGGLIRGRSNIAPGLLVFGLAGTGGQAVVNVLENKLNMPGKSHSTKQGWNSNWSPLKSLTKEEYKKILEEKLLRIEADIAVVEDNIQKLQKSDTQSRTIGSSGKTA